jgi:hypothetical protein
MKNILPALVALILLFTVYTARAATFGPYTYTVTSGKATITDFDTTYSGTLSITNTLGGCPVTSIDMLAFYLCTKLTDVTIPDTVTNINDGAFSRCRGLTNVTIPDSVTTIGNQAFWVCTNLTNITIPNGVTTIGNHAFDSCTSLANVSIADSVTTIGDSTFRSCTNLTKATLGNGVTAIGNSAFYLCANLANVTFGTDLTTIGEAAFAHCSNLTNVTIPGNVTNIDYGAFNGCTALARVYFAGNPPTPGPGVFASAPATIYYLPAYASFWPATFAYCPTKLWNPDFTATDFTAGQISCTVTGSPTIPIAFEATTNLTTGPWLRLQTTALTSTSLVLHDPDSTNYPTRFYRIIGP